MNIVDTSDAPSPRCFHPFVLGLVGGVLQWAALPPLGGSWLAWVAPVSYLLLVRQPRLIGRRPYLWLWLASCLHWLAVMQGIRQAHVVLNLGWVALSAYVAVYLPLFVGLSRVAVHRVKVPILIAAPLVWIGLEVFRGWFLTGFSLALLGHTQAHWPEMIQIADAGGAYWVSGLVVFVAACLTELAPVKSDEERAGRWSVSFRPQLLIPLIAVVGPVWLYGVHRLRQPELKEPVLRVGLVQSAMDTIFEINAERNLKTFRQCVRGTLAIRQQAPDIDLIIWPESAFTANMPEFLVDVSSQPPTESGLSDEEFRQFIAEAAENLRLRARLVTGNLAPQERPPRTFVLVGTETQDQRGGRSDRFNTALLFGPDGTIQDRYYKQHPVMFGEYIPLGETFPIIYRLSPMPFGLTPGREAAAFSVHDWRVSPSICFEVTVPHLIRRQVRELSAAGRSPDVLVNVTNDGWFWGSSILDLQFRCAVFRAVENRRPLLVAANTGLTGWIDGSGRIREVAPRREEAQIVAVVLRDGRDGMYQRLGDGPGWLCVLACGVLAGIGIRDRRKFV